MNCYSVFTNNKEYIVYVIFILHAYIQDEIHRAKFIRDTLDAPGQEMISLENQFKIKKNTVNIIRFDVYGQ